jgi:uridine kinase
MKEVFIIGIAGGSGSGKTKLAKNILKEIDNEQVQSIGVDSYYKDLLHLTFEERTKNNFDHPNSIDFNLLYDDLKSIINNKTIYVPLYDYKTHTREKNKSRKIENVKIIILEGILALYDTNIRELMSMKIFVDTSNDVRLLRRIKRDVNKRARTIESVIEQYNNTVKPMFLKFVKPTKDYADLIVPYGGKNKILIDAIVTNIKKTYI